MLSFMYFAIGLGALLVALALCLVLLRLARTLAAAEDVLLTANEELRATLPEVREGIANVNQISAGVNAGLQVAGSGASRIGARVRGASATAERGLRAGGHGFRVAVSSLAGSLGRRGTEEQGGFGDGR